MNSSLNKPNRNSSWNDLNNDSSWNKPNMNSSWNDPNSDLNWNDSNKNLSWNKAKGNSSWNDSNKDLSWNKAKGISSLNKLNKNIGWNSPNKKMIMAMVASVIVLISAVSIFACSANTETDSNKGSGFLNKILASKDKSEGLVTDYSDIDNTWNDLNASSNTQTSNSDSINTEVVTGGVGEDESINNEEIEQQNTIETASTEDVSNTTGTEEIIATVTPTMAPTDTPIYIPTSAPTVTPTMAPTVAPTVRPTVTPTVAPTVTPTVAPDPYAYLATSYSKKDSSGKIVYILANSDSRNYTAMELASLTKQQLRFARNEIFARRGGKFTASDLQQYFNSRSWYTPLRNAADFEDPDLNSYELANVKLIKSLE